MTLDLVAIRRELHRYPETAFCEHRTAQFIESVLQQLGLQSRRMGGTGVVADIAGNLPGPLIALRADIDALPVAEQSGVEYASEIPGNMHACGHDTHATMLLGAGERLLARRDNLRGGVRLIFQPAEETTQGAQALIDAGVLEGVAAIFGIHNYPSLSVGQAAFRTGPLMASSDRIVVKVRGKGGHAASPHLTSDPLVAAAAMLTGMQTVVSRAVNPLEPVVITIGRMQGGTTFNVIPETAELEGTVRCFSSAVRTAIPELLQRVLTGIASGYGCSVELACLQMVPAVHNDDTLTDIARQEAVRLLGAQSVLPAEPTMGAEDFALYQERVPGCFFWLGSGGSHNWHHPAYAVDERMLPIGAGLLAATAEAALRKLRC